MGEAGEKKIVFNISEGIKATVARIVFTGNKHFSSRRLRKQMKEVKENNIVTWIRKKNLYIPSKLDEDLEHIKNYYQDYGYTNVAFGEPQIDDGRNGEEAAREDHHPDQGRDDPSPRRRHRHRHDRLQAGSVHRQLPGQEGRHHPPQADSGSPRRAR